jgi:hypothetical protein
MRRFCQRELSRFQSTQCESSYVETSDSIKIGPPKLLSCGEFEKNDSLKVSSLVDTLRDQGRPIPRHHILASFGSQCPKPDISRVDKVDHTFLASFGTQADRRIPIVEEHVVTRPITVDVGRVDKAQTPSSSTVLLLAVLKTRIGVTWIEREWDRRGRIALIVGCFVLDHSQPAVASVFELITVENRMFGRGAPEPVGTVALDQEAAVTC